MTSASPLGARTRWPRQAPGHRSPRGARARPGPGRRAPRAPRRRPGEGGRVPSRPGAPVCAARGQVRGRAEVSGSSRWAARSAAAALGPGRPQLAPRPRPPEIRSPHPLETVGSGPRRVISTLDSHKQGPGLGPGAQATSHRPAAGPAAHPVLGFSRPGGNFLGHPRYLSVSKLPTPEGLLG